jgi:hypothetical protein
MRLAVVAQFLPTKSGLSIEGFPPAGVWRGMEGYNRRLIEDIRAKKVGFKSLCVHSAIMWHKFGQAAIRMNWFHRQKQGFKGMVIFYSRHAKPYKLPSLMFYYILSQFLKEEVLEGFISVLTNKEKREKFKKMVRHTLGITSAA